MNIFFLLKSFTILNSVNMELMTLPGGNLCRIKGEHFTVFAVVGDFLVLMKDQLFNFAIHTVCAGNLTTE